VATARRQLGYVSSLTTQTSLITGVYGVATGGTSSSINVGGQDYTLLTFTSDSNLVVSQSGVFDFLLIGGGGGGGGATSTNGNGGGGGGGGILGLDDTLTVYLAAGTYTVDVGVGGVGSSSYNNAGNPSLVGQSIIVYGGGRGGSYAQATNDADGSNLFRIGGAGANAGGISTSASYRNVAFSNNDSRIGLGAVNNQYAGGAGRNNFASGENSGAGGGGGAGGNGGNPSTNVGGNGGDGRDISSWITGSTYYAGAGGGGAGTSTAGSAGLGGVAGVTSGTGNNGVNYGAGGGGARNGAGGSGAAGAVFVRFKV